MTSSYSERQRIEKLYHDQKYREPSTSATDERTTNYSRGFRNVIGQPKGLTILDFGCGDGWLSVLLAKFGNIVHGIDISEVLIERAKKFAEISNVSDRTSFREMPAENLDFPAHFFDMVVGNSVLHHTELEITLGNISHALKPGGTAVFMEPLNQNICLQVWRLLTPRRRSKTERALSKHDLARIQRFFPSSRFTYYCFTSMFTEGLLLIFPNNRLLLRIDTLLEAIDDRLIRTFPSLGRFSAVVVIELRK